LSQIGNTTTSSTPTTATSFNKNNNENTGTKELVGWIVANFNLLQIDEMKKWILLDNQSTQQSFAIPTWSKTSNIPMKYWTYILTEE